MGRTVTTILCGQWDFLLLWDGIFILKLPLDVGSHMLGFADGKLTDKLWCRRHGETKPGCGCKRLQTNITVTSHEHHYIPNYWQLDQLFNSVFRLTTKKTSKNFIMEFFTPVRGIYSHKGLVKWKVFPCHEMFMNIEYITRIINSLCFVVFCCGLVECVFMSWHHHELTHCGLVTPHGNKDLVQHWLR